MSLLRKLFWRLMEVKEISVSEFAKKYIHLEEIKIPHSEERNKLIQECEEEFEEMPMFQHEEEYNPLIKKLKRLSKLDFIAGVYCSQRIQNLKKEDEVNDYFKEQYDSFNQHLCWTKLVIKMIRNRRDNSDDEYAFN